MLREVLERSHVPQAALTLVEDMRRETMVELLQLSDIVDLAIPRGGEGLIRFVAEHARVLASPGAGALTSVTKARFDAAELIKKI